VRSNPLCCCGFGCMLVIDLWNISGSEGVVMEGLGRGCLRPTHHCGIGAHCAFDFIMLLGLVSGCVLAVDFVDWILFTYRRAGKQI
jgi:hypothetical protein